MNKTQILAWPPMVIGLALVCAMLWGSAIPCLKMGFVELGIQSSTGGKLYFAAYRFMLAGVAIFIVLAALGQPIRLRCGREYVTMLFLGLMQTTLMYALFYVGISHTSGIKASIITGVGSFFLAFFSHFWMKDDRMSLAKIAGLVLGFSGIVIINLQRGRLDWAFQFLGEGLLILTSLLSALGTLVVKQAAATIHPVLMTAYQLFFGALGLFVIARGLAPPDMVRFSTIGSIGLLIYLSFISAAAFSLWYVLIKYNQLSNMAVYRFLIPVCSTFLAAYMLGEPLTANALIALVLVAAGMVLTAL